MKKFIILFMIIHIFSYANYLISNSEIVLFYDKSYNSIHYMRGDVFQGIDISRIEGKLILDGEKVISVNKYFESANLIPQTNILKLNYNIDGKYLTVNIIPSMIEKDKLYFVVEFVNFLKDNRKVDFAFRIAPQYDNKYVEYNESKDSYGYDRFYFKSENYKGETYIARDSVIEELMLEKVEGKIKKYQDDNMYYIIHNVDYNKPIEFVVKFYRDFEEDKKEEGTEVLSKELAYWENVNSNIKFLEDLYSKKSENQKVVYYTFLFKYLNVSGDYLAPKLLNEKIIPEVESILGYLEEENEEIINIRDNINNYYWYYELINNIENRPEFVEKRDFILAKKKLLLNYINRNYVLDDGLKIRKESSESYYKNIRFMSFLPKEKQLKILKEDYKKYYNRFYGLLKPKGEERIDLGYNLDFIIKLYENGERDLADVLFANLETYIRRNDYYIIPDIYPDKDNPAGIYGELLYLYFIAAENKERYGN